MIIYFSGTGNTRHCAAELSRLIGDQTLEIKGGMLLSPSLTRVATDDKRIIWMFPVYSWGIPPVVESFLCRAIIKVPSDAVHHLVVTCGDDIGKTDMQWRKILCERGFKDAKAFSVIMPNTYVLMKGFDTDPQELEDKKIADSAARLEHIASEIGNLGQSEEKTERSADATRGRFAAIKSSLIYPWFIRHAMSPKPFHVNDKCTGCGLCAKNCPLGNIILIGHHKPLWSQACALCLRCYHICPHHAVEYGNKTATKGQYTRFLK